MIHAIDPGVHVSAVASGTREQGLVQIGAIDNHMTPSLPSLDSGIWPPRTLDIVVCEKPVFRTKFAKSVGDLRDVVGQHRLHARMCGASFEDPEPAQWKGQIKKPHQHRKLFTSVLTPYERDLVCKALRRDETDVFEWIMAACRKLALKQDPGYDSRGHKVGRHKVKDNDILDCVALLMVRTGRL
jgi:hypothetical protein